MPLHGGEPRQLTDLPNGAGAAEWSPDGKRVLLLAGSGEKRFLVGKADDPIARRIRDYTWKIDGGGSRDECTSVWTVDVEAGKPARLRAPTYDVGGACWSPDGKQIEFIADMRQEAAILEYPQLWSLPSRPGKAEPTPMASLAGAVFNAAWAPAEQVAILGTSEPESAGWCNVDLYVTDGKTTRQLAAGRDLDIWNTTYGDFEDNEQLIAQLCWIDQHNVAGLVEHRGSSHPYSFGVDGSVKALAEEDVVCNAIAAGGGRVAVVASRDGPADVYAVEDGKLRRLSDDGSKWFGPFRSPIERVEVPHPDGHNIDACLLRAHGQAAQPPPALPPPARPPL